MRALELLDPDPVDVQLMRGYPGPWLQPVTIERPDGSHRLACRLCIARGGSVVAMVRTEGELLVHLVAVHHLAAP